MCDFVLACAHLKRRDRRQHQVRDAVRNRLLRGTNIHVQIALGLVHALFEELDFHCWEEMGGAEDFNAVDTRRDVIELELALGGGDCDVGPAVERHARAV